MKVLLTGSSGYIGSVLVDILLARGHSVLGIDNGLFESCRLVDRQAKIKTMIKDIREIEATDLEGIEAIVHLAGLCNDDLGAVDEGLTEEINHLATVSLAGLAKRSGIKRFIFPSSCSVYGDAGDDLIDEKSGLRPLTAYARMKFAVENDLRSLADRNFHPIILRLATVFGWSANLRFDLVVNNLVAWAMATGKVRLKSDGRSWRPLVHVDDVGEVIRSFLELRPDAVAPEPINCGIIDGNFRIVDVASCVASIVPGSDLVFADGHSPDRRSYRVDCSRICRILPGWQPRWNLTRGATDLYRRLLGFDLLPDDFEGPRYDRIAHLARSLEQGKFDRSLNRLRSS